MAAAVAMQTESRRPVRIFGRELVFIMACVFLRDRCRVRSSENKPIHTLTDPPMQFSIRCWFIAFHSPTTVGSRSSANHLTSSYLLGVSNPDRPQARGPRETQGDKWSTL